jgi:hypothetical protein
MRTELVGRRLARRLALLAAIALSLTTCGDDGESPPAGGGGGGTSTPQQYAQRMCGAASTWMTALEDRNTQLQGDLGGAQTGDLEAIKELTVAFLDGAVQETETLIDDVSAIPPPQVDDGGQIHDGVLNAFTQARDLFIDARDQVSELDTSDPQAFSEALTTLGTTLTSAGTEIAGSVQGLENDELDAAFEDTPACADVSA